jgi:hypothetical protein
MTGECRGRLSEPRAPKWFALFASLVAASVFAAPAFADGTPTVPKPDPPPVVPKPTPKPVHKAPPPPVRIVHHVVAPPAPKPVVQPPAASTPVTTTPVAAPRPAPKPVVHKPAPRQQVKPVVRPLPKPPLVIDRPAAGPAPAAPAPATSTGWTHWLLPLGVFLAAVSLLLLVLATVPVWAVSSPLFATFLRRHRNDLAFTGFALLAVIAVVSVTVGLNSG